MKLMQMLNQAFRYLSEAAMLIFAPTEHHYPATGIVPFMGDDYKRSWAD